MRRLIFVLPFLALALIAVVGPVTASTAFAIAPVVMVISPFVLKYVKASGPLMAILSFAVALGVAIVAGFVSKELVASDFTAINLYATAAALWAVQQAVFQLFKDNHTFGKFLK